MSAVATLRLALDLLLRLFAPIVPYITEEVWSWAFADEKAQPSIHRAPWPSLPELESIEPPADPDSLQLAIDALATIHKAKSEQGASAGRTVERLELVMDSARAARVAPVLSDVLASARVREHRLLESPNEGFAIGEMVLEPKLEQPA